MWNPCYDAYRERVNPPRRSTSGDCVEPYKCCKLHRYVCRNTRARRTKLTYPQTADVAIFPETNHCVTTFRPEISLAAGRERGGYVRERTRFTYRRCVEVRLWRCSDSAAADKRDSKRDRFKRTMKGVWSFVKTRSYLFFCTFFRVLTTL